MAERLTPGVYVELVSGGARPIQAVGTSTAAFIGMAEKGIPDRATFLGRFADYERHFGGHRRGPDGYLAQAVQAFFDAGGRRAYVVRVLPRDATAAAAPAPLAARAADAWGATRDVLQVAARGRGAWANAVRVHVEEATGFPNEAFRLRVETVEGGRARTVELFDDVRMDPEHPDYVVRVVEEGSSFITLVDLFQTGFVDADERTAPPLPERAPLLVASPNHLTGEDPPEAFRVPVGARWLFSWRDPGSGRGSDLQDPPTVDFDEEALRAAEATIDGRWATLTTDQFGAFVDDALGGDFRVAVADGEVRIGPAVASRAYLVAEAGDDDVFDLSDLDALRVVARNGATADDADREEQVYEVDLTPAERDALGAEALAELINAAVAAGDDPHGVTAEGSGRFLVVRAGPRAAGTVLAANATPAGGGAAIDPWPPVIDALPGSAGFDDVESMNLVEVTVSEVIQPGVDRVLGAIVPQARATGLDESHPADPALRPALTGDAPVRLLGGSDGVQPVVAADFRGTEQPQRTGLHAFDVVDVNVLAMPGRTSADFLAVGVAYCDRNDVFLVADGVGSDDPDFEVSADEVRQIVEGLPARSMNAAMFYPWVEVPDPLGIGRNPRRLVPPSGHVAGIFARTDTTRGVWKAPAGIEAVVSGAVDVQHRLVDAEQDLFNPIGLNCIRQFPNIGIVSWGARTLSADPEWRYINVVRMAHFLKRSIRLGLQWAVFEPNDTELWDRIRINLHAFMLGLFRQGAFQGATPEEAFFVKCDRETNPQELVDQGIVTSEVAFAPLKPAEFVVVRLSQKSLLTV